MHETSDKVEVLFIDLFAGAGGVSTGVSKDSRVKVVACINHDKNAIKSHALNHPDCVHFTEDIRSVQMNQLVDIVSEYKLIYPNAKVWIHASLECTNFSRAKGGAPKNNESRSLAEDMPRYSLALNPDFFSIENVREFMDYGPLDDDLQPIKDKKGCYYNIWVEKMKSLNSTYHYGWKILNAADYGGYTTRKRYFALFSKESKHIVWPKITHFKGKNYKSVKDLLEFNELGNSVVFRKKPLSDATLLRIFNGLKTYKKQYLISYYSTGKNFHSIEDPAITVTTKDRLSLISPFIVRELRTGYLSSIEEPTGSLFTVPKINLVTSFLVNPQWKSEIAKSIEEPCFTLIARMDKAPPQLVQSVSGKFSETKEKDSEIMKELKAYMKENNIRDIYIRSLNIKELLQIQGFPKDYKLVGTQTEQKKFIGNSVETTVMHKWIEAVLNTF